MHNHKPQPFPDIMITGNKQNMRKSNKRTKSTKISYLFLGRDDRNAETEKHQSKITQGKTLKKIAS